MQQMMRPTSIKRVILLTKTVPRNSMRTRWRETGNYQPDLMTKKDYSKLFKDDLVFVRNAENSLDFLKVVKDTNLTDHRRKVSVIEPFTKKVMEIDLSKLVTKKGYIVSVPKKLYSIEKDQVIFNDVVDHVLEVIRNPSESMLDEDIELMCENPIEDVIRVPTDDGPSTSEIMKGNMNEGNPQMKRMTRMDIGNALPLPLERESRNVPNHRYLQMRTQIWKYVFSCMNMVQGSGLW